MNMMFSRYPAQDPEDAFEWEANFADPKIFRDCRFEPDRGWVVPSERRPAFLAGIEALGTVAEVV